MIREAIIKLSRKENLTYAEAEAVMDEIMSGQTTPVQTSAYARCDKLELVGGTPAENAAITRAILSGEERGAKRQAVCLNAGAALYIGGKASSMAEGVRMAESILDSGAALAKLEAVIRRTGA